MNTTEIHTKLKALPEPIFRNRDWPDYVSLGFGENEVEALLDLASDFYLSFEQSDKESAMSIHAWRVLAEMGEIGLLPEFISLAIECDDINDEWFADDFPILIGKLGMAALPELAQAVESLPEYPCLAEGLVEALPKMVRDGNDRETALVALVDFFRHQLSDRDSRALVVLSLIELKAFEALEVVQDQYEHNRINVSIAGDLEEAELQLGGRTERATSKPDLVVLEEELAKKEREELAGDYPVNGTLEEKMQHFLIRYGSARSIQRMDELDGYLVSLCISGSKMSLGDYSARVWDTVEGNEEFTPEFASKKEEQDWQDSLGRCVRELEQGLRGGTYQPHVSVWPDAEDSMDPDAPYFSPWLDGLMAGAMHFGPENEEDESWSTFSHLVSEIQEKEEDGLRLLEDADENPMYALMEWIQDRFSS